MNKNKKAEEQKTFEEFLGIFGLILLIIGGLFNLTGTAIAGGVLVYTLLYDSK